MSVHVSFMAAEDQCKGEKKRPLERQDGIDAVEEKVTALCSLSHGYLREIQEMAERVAQLQNYLTNVYKDLYQLSTEYEDIMADRSNEVYEYARQVEHAAQFINMADNQMAQAEDRLEYLPS